MATYWHVAPATYQAGEDLLSWDRQADLGWVAAEDWKWRDAPVGFDGNVVCLYADRDQAEEHLACETPGGVLLAVEIEDEDTVPASDWQDAEIQMTTVEEGFPAVRDRIPARCITIAPPAPTGVEMRPETTAEAKIRETRAAAGGLTTQVLTDRTWTVHLGDRQIGEVTRGINDEWYPIGLNRAAWADPLEGRDNVHGTGHRTPMSVALGLIE